ncbi:MAG: HAD-IIIA family hydrolase [Clostridia bacterium]|nr:HAD-IIIA family hydrolase [Clostridia bacterium]
MKAVILAGGKGTRMGDACLETPKPMLLLGDKPILLHQIEALRREGVKDFLLVVGYLSAPIRSFFGDGSRFGVHIDYYEEEKPLGTAGALFRIPFDADFLLLNGDLLFDFSLERLLRFHRSRAAGVTLLAHPNDHPLDSATLRSEDDGLVTALIGRQQEKAPFGIRNLCNAGIQIVSPAALEGLQADGPADFDKDVVMPNIRRRTVYAYLSHEYVRDLGTPLRLEAADRDLQAGTPAAMRVDAVKRAVFLDRDGTVNVYKGYLSRAEDMELLPGVSEAIRLLHRLGFLVIIASNQPVVARGMCSLQELRRIHDRMELLLAEQHSFADEIRFCPHHPDKGFPGENAAFKCVCGCRKPAPGMLTAAAEENTVSLADSYMVGDTLRDIETARAAGCRPVFLRCGATKEDPPGVPAYDDLYAFARALGKELQKGCE